MGANQQTSLSLLFVATTTIFLSGNAHGWGHQDLCAGATYPDLCRSVVRRAKTPYAAAEATVKRLISESKKIKRSAEKLPKRDSSTCLSVYDDALDSLKMSRQSLKSDDIGSFNVNLSAVISNCETCKDSYNEMDKPFPLEKQNELIKHIASNGLYIATMIR